MNMHIRKTRSRAAKRPAHFSEDNTLAFVPTASGETIMLDREDYDRLMAMGISPNWNVTNPTRKNAGRRYAHVWHPTHKNLIAVSRLIMGTGRGEVVSFINGNTLDHRRANLKVEGGPAKRDQHISTFDPFQFG